MDSTIRKIYPFFFPSLCVCAGLLAIILTIYVRLATTNTITVSTTAFWTVNGILAIGLLVIVFMLGMQSKGNAIFTLSFLHPMPPAIVLLASIYLCTAIDVAAWIRFTIWMVIGKMNFVNPQLWFMCIWGENSFVVFLLSLLSALRDQAAFIKLARVNG